MITSNPVQAIFHEIAILPKVIKGMKQLNYNITQAFRYLFRRIIAPEKFSLDKPLFVTPQGIPLYSRRDFVSYHSLFLLNEYAIEYWSHDLRAQKHPLIMDVGTNLGFFSALCLQINPSARMVCFELVPECRPIIEQRFHDLNAKDYTIEIGAVGSKSEGIVNICYENPFTSTNNVDLQDGTFKIAVPAIALDKWFSKNEYKTGNTPFLIKIDVEGAEEDVIIGGKNTLESAQFILTEMHKTRRALDLLMTTHEIVYDACCSADTWILILKKKTQIKRPYH